MTLLPLGSQVKLLNGLALIGNFIPANAIGTVTNNFKDPWADNEGLFGVCLAVKFEGQANPLILFYSEIEPVGRAPTEEEIDELI